jgi:hypothetical protein
MTPWRIPPAEPISSRRPNRAGKSGAEQNLSVDVSAKKVVILTEAKDAIDAIP